MNKKEWIIKKLKEDENLNDTKLILTIEELIKEEDLSFLDNEENLFLVNVTENNEDNYCDPNYIFEVCCYTKEDNLKALRFCYDSFTDCEEYFPTIMLFEVKHKITKSINLNTYKTFELNYKIKLKEEEKNKILNEIRAFESERDYYQAEINRLNKKINKMED